MDELNLKNQLEFYLEKEGITAAELSRRSGVPKSSISDWIAGMSPKNLTYVKKIASVFNTTIDNLLFGNGGDDLTVSNEPVKDISNLLGENWLGGVFELRIRKYKGK